MDGNKRMIRGNTNFDEPFKEMCISTITRYLPFYEREELILLSLMELAQLTDSALNIGGMYK